MALPERVVGSGSGGGASGATGVRAAICSWLGSSCAMRRRLADVLGFAERGARAGGGVGGGGGGMAEMDRLASAAGEGAAMIEGSASGRTKPKDISSTWWRLGHRLAVVDIERGG